MKLGRDEKHTSLIRLGRAIITPARLYVFVALLLFAAWGSAWGACRPASATLQCRDGFSYRDNVGGCSGSPSQSYSVPYCSDTSSFRNCTVITTDNSRYYCTLSSVSVGSACYSYGSTSIPYSFYYCDTQCEADSLTCVQGGGTWIPSSNPGECGECRNECPEQPCADGSVWDPDSCACVSDPCAPDRAACRRVGGKWSGSFDKVLNCCSSVCDVCSNAASRNVFRLKRNECCSQNQAPPADDSRCDIPVQSGCGMSTSQFTDPSSGDWNCQDPNGSDAAHSRYYEMCSDDWDGGDGGSSDSGGSSSSDGSSSSMSSSSQSSSSQGDGSSSSGEGGDGDCPECPLLEDIKDILGSIDGTTSDILLCLQIPHLCPALDQDVDLSGVIKELQDIEDIAGEIRDYSITSLRNDTVTWTKFDALGNVVDTSIHVMNDTTRKWLNAIADSLGVGTDSLIAHLDSIIKTIPDSVMDSIVKYQKYATDNFDSIIYGTGKGFSLVDSLIDSSVKYFQESNRIWNNYIDTYADSMGSLHSTLDGLPYRISEQIGLELGYGDTASSTLRGDLNGIRGAIDGLGDGIGAGVAAGLDSAWGEGTALEGSGYGGYGSDSSGYSGVLEGAAGEGAGSADTSYAIEGDTCTTVDCIAAKVNVDSMGQAFSDSLASDYARISDSAGTWFDSIRQNLKFVDFDSVLLEPLKNVVPNLNACPEECFKGRITTIRGMQATEFDLGVCKNFTIGGVNINALLFVRLLLRILTAVCCIYIGLWYIAGRK